MNTFLRLTSLVAAAGAVQFALAQSSDDVVMRAMRDELTRTSQELKLEDNAPPYFVAYRVTEGVEYRVLASFGAILERDRSQHRNASVELRVGTPQFDQSYYLTNSGNAPWGTQFTASLPLDDNYTEIRRQLWLATDNAYKRSVDWLAKKKAALQNKTRPDDTGDFTLEPPTQSQEEKPGIDLENPAVEKLARDLSAIFREYSAVANSSVMIATAQNRVRYLNSESTTYKRCGPGVVLAAIAQGQAADGRILVDTSMHFVENLDGLPPKEKLTAEVRQLAQHITDLTKAPLPESYNGPVLFEGEAAAEIFQQVFVRHLVTMKRPVLGVKSFSNYMPLAENSFMDRVGGRVLPEFLNLIDDPTRTEFNGQELLGAAKNDDEGVPTRAVTLVEDGRIKTLLSDRVPTPGFLKSTGSRHGGGPCPTNLFLTSTQGMEPAALKAKLIKLAQLRGRNYGLVVRRISRPYYHGPREEAVATDREAGRIEPAILVYKLFVDGHEELLRNCEISGATVASFKDIVAVGNDPIVYNAPVSIVRVAGLSSNELFSEVVPSLLFDELTVKAPGSEAQKPPLSPHPYFAKSAHDLSQK